MPPLRALLRSAVIQHEATNSAAPNDHDPHRRRRAPPATSATTASTAATTVAATAPVAIAATAAAAVRLDWAPCLPTERQLRCPVRPP